MNFCKLLIQALFGILLILITHGDAVPIPRPTNSKYAGPSQPSNDQTSESKMDSPFFPWYGPKNYSQPEAAIGTVQAPKTSEDNQVGDKAVADTQPDGSSFIETHPVVVIVLFALSPFIICMILYPILKWHKMRRDAPKPAKKFVASENNDQFRVDEKYPGTPTSAYANNPHLEPLPAYPNMVYIPPAANCGHSIFGHLRSPSGEQVLSVTDRWVMAGAGDLDIEKSPETILVHQV